MQRYFSPSTGGFYSDVINGPRQIEGELSRKEIKAGKRPPLIDNPNCTLPADAVPITDRRYDELMRAQAEGKMITAIGSKPLAVERTIDENDRVTARRRTRDRLLAASDWTQLPDSPLDAVTKKAWFDYRQQLRDLDMSGTNWPVEPGAELAAS
jgi:hypothetical protein